jgi:hypothetical protein
MDQRQQHDAIDQHVQPPPAQAAEPLDHAVGRGRRQRRQAEPGGAADDQIPAVADLVHDLAEVEHLVGGEQRQMRGDAAEAADAKHTPRVDQIAEMQNAPEWRHR